MIIELTNEDFNKEVASGLVLVDFYATWCGPCKMMHPVIEEISSSYSDLKIIKVDVDKHEEVAKNYTIMSIPTIILFKNGKIINKNIGFTSSDLLKDWINNTNK